MNGGQYSALGITPVQTDEEVQALYDQHISEIIPLNAWQEDNGEIWQEDNGEIWEEPTT